MTHETFPKKAAAEYSAVEKMGHEKHPQKQVDFIDGKTGEVIVLQEEVLPEKHLDERA